MTSDFTPVELAVAFLPGTLFLVAAFAWMVGRDVANWRSDAAARRRGEVPPQRFYL